MEKNELTIYEIPEPDTVKKELQKIQQYQHIVQQTLIEGLDYGVIPGTSKPTLLKPGAEKIVKIHGLTDEYEIIERIENWEKPFFYYLFKCKLKNLKGITVSEGVGSCNSLENRYRWRWVREDDLPQGINKNTLTTRTTQAGLVLYRIENDDIYSQVNTLEKMAKKRAFVDATLSACRLSAVFTQDIEDVQIEEPKQELSESKTRLLQALHQLFNGDKEKMKEALFNLTTYTDSEGVYHEGKTSLFEISDRMANVAYGKLKKMSEKNDSLKKKLKEMEKKVENENNK